MVATLLGWLCSATWVRPEGWWEAVQPYHPALAAAAAVVGLVLTVVLHFGAVARSGGSVVVAGFVSLAVMLQQEAISPLAAVVGCSVLLGSWVVGRVPENSSVPWLGAVSLVGVWAAVPDTEPALIAAAIIGVPVTLGVVRRSSRADRLGALAMVVFCAWAGSAGRYEIVGGVGCVAMLVAPLPPVRVADRGFLRLLVVHTALVLLAARVVTRLDPPWALGAVVVILAVAVEVGRRLRADALSRGEGVRELP